MFLLPFYAFCYVNAQHSHNLNEIDNKLSQTPKYIIFELYTDWCGVCAIQHKKIQKNETLKFILDERFYYIRFDAESKETVVFNGHEFRNKDKIHDFAKAILPESNAFPAWIIMNPDLEIIFQYNGLLEPRELEAVLLKLNILND